MTMIDRCVAFSLHSTFDGFGIALSHMGPR